MAEKTNLNDKDIEVLVIIDWNVTVWFDSGTTFRGIWTCGRGI